MQHASTYGLIALMSLDNPNRKAFEPYYYFHDLRPLADELYEIGPDYFVCREDTIQANFVRDAGDGVTYAIDIISTNTQEKSRQVGHGVLLGLTTINFIQRPSIRTGIITTINQAGHNNKPLRDNAQGYIDRCSDKARHTKNVDIDYKELLGPVHTAIADIYPDPERELCKLSTQRGFLVATHAVMQMTREWDLWIDHVIGTTQEK